MPFPTSLYLGDNESVLTDVNKLVGEGSKATLAKTPNMDILEETIGRFVRGTTF